MTELHPLTELLIARAKAHPEEFEGMGDAQLGGPYDSRNNRWHYALSVLRAYAPAHDREVFAETIGRIQMDKAHEWALDEMMNGEERRAKAEREMAEEKQKYYAQLQQAQAQAQAQAATVKNAYPVGLPVGNGGAGPTQFAHTKLSSKLTLSDSLIDSIKEALGHK